MMVTRLPWSAASFRSGIDGGSNRRGNMVTIYFDLDGTLTDPKPGITRSIQYALRRLDRAVPSEEELTWCIGPPLHASLKTLLGTDDLADKALSLYRERFSDIGLFENAVYPGIE